MDTPTKVQELIVYLHKVCPKKYPFSVLGEIFHMSAKDVETLFLAHREGFSVEDFYACQE
ncbi:MAG: hypothetical protein HN726_03625 [Candidatus Magasanikbacteria bacterium]|jgi:hypothetical protein|nr:hypothetical protein [Candidatus Magasanikbacteria bacterium]MBT4221353.1 hypothetical protein [Candidatus Magasanikbacteria bacterium]MBT4350799.1 hypothetical protein [Candidatus Magasanikbacteria bacterium]MBT4541525.1 hypothetical protein [Candidatus Magasanikbacteria bacterium]MBT6253477.1 hypothetical protein [Candidatus Magasanikbacteria bacterium]